MEKKCPPCSPRCFFHRSVCTGLKLVEKITIFNGKIHCKWWFSIAMLNYQRVSQITPFRWGPESNTWKYTFFGTMYKYISKRIWANSNDSQILGKKNVGWIPPWSINYAEEVVKSLLPAHEGTGKHSIGKDWKTNGWSWQEDACGMPLAVSTRRLRWIIPISRKKIMSKW